MILLFESLGNIAGSRSGKGKGGGVATTGVPLL